MRQKLLILIRWVRKLIRKYFHSYDQELPYYLSILIAAIVFGIALKGFIELTDGLRENRLPPYDNAVTDFVISFRSPGLTEFFQLITEMGDRIVYIAITIILGLFFWFRFRNRKFVFQIVLVLILSSLSNVMLKQALNRSRPVMDHLVEVNTLSYPSGHAMSAMAFYGFLIYLCVRYKMKRWLRVFFVTVLVMIVLSVGLSRIYLGVHYPSDVAAGLIGGLIWVTFSVAAFNIFDMMRERRSAKKNI